MKAGFACTVLESSAGLTNPNIRAVVSSNIPTSALKIFCLTTSTLKHITDRTGEPVSSVVEMRQGTDAEKRAADAAGHPRYRSKRVIQKIIQLEDDRRRRR